MPTKKIVEIVAELTRREYDRFHLRLVKLENDSTWVKWLLGIVLAGVAGLYFKQF